MKRRIFVLMLIVTMTVLTSIPAWAVDSDSNGEASGTTSLSGEIEYTTAYTLSIPADVNNMDLSQDAETALGNVSVAKQNDNAEFNPEKGVSVTVDYDGELVNAKDSSKIVTYKLQQYKDSDEATDIVTGDVLDFTAAEIETGNVSYGLNAIVTETNKSGGTYSGTINFSASVVNEKISFQIACGEKDTVTWKTYEVDPGTTWAEFINSSANTAGITVDPDDNSHVLCSCDEYWLKDRTIEGNGGLEVFKTDVIQSNAKYSC